MEVNTVRKMDDFTIQLQTEWIDTVKNVLNVSRPEDIRKISDAFIESYQHTDMVLYNSVNHTYKNVDSAWFYYNVPEKCILNENGVLTFKTEVKSSVLKEVMLKDIEIRQIHKRAKIQAEMAGDELAAAHHKVDELSNKTVINGFYGLMAYLASYFFNIDLADTITTAGRNIVSVAGISAELIGNGFRNYLLDSHIQLIDYAVKTKEKIIGKYTLPEPTIEQVLYNMLLTHYDNYYAKSFLKHKLSSLSKEELGILYLKNNMVEFLKVPEVNEVIDRLISNVDETHCIMNYKAKDIKDENGNIIEKDRFRDDINLLKKMTKDLLFGFVSFNGDYIDGEFQPTLVDIISNKMRTTVGNMDTDSANPTTYREVHRMKMEKVTKDMNDVVRFNVEEVGIPMIIANIFVAYIEEALYDYNYALGVDKGLINRVELELEHVIEQIHFTMSKKQYSYIATVSDMHLNSERKLKITGLLHTKSNFNSEVAVAINEILFNKIMCRIEDLSYPDLINTINKTTQNNIDMIRTADFIRNKKTVLKISDDNIMLSDYRKKSCLFWNSVYGKRDFGMIELPGSFGIIKIKFTQEMLDRLKTEHFDEYNDILEYAKLINRYKFCSRAFKLADGWINDENEADDEEEVTYKLKKIEKIFIEEFDNFRDDFEKICEHILKYDIIDYYDEFFEYLMSSMEQMPLQMRSHVEYLWGYDTYFNALKKEDELIIKVCDRIAVPIDIIEIPAIITNDNFAILDIEAASEFEHLISSSVNTLSIVCPRNKSSQIVVTSILRTF